VAKVLSTTTSAPAACAISAMASMSAIASSGFVGVSIQTAVVSPGRIAFSTAARSVDTPSRVYPGEEPERAAVRVAGHHEMAARSADRTQQGVLGGQPAGERQPVLAALERGQALL
jgi:hypothetical protein